MHPQPPPCPASGGTALSRGHWARGCCHISTSEPCHLCLGEGAGHTGGAAGTDLAGGLMPLLREAKGGQGSTERGLGWGSRFLHTERLQSPVGTPDPGHSLGVLGSQPIPEHMQHNAVMPVPRLPGKPNQQQRLQSTHSSGSAWSCSSWEEPGLSILPCSLRRTPMPGSQPKPGPPSSDDSQLHLVCFHPLVPAAPGWMGTAVGPN